MASVSEDRPNIRIEIQNIVGEPMEIDDEDKLADSDFEDGEISDKNEPPEVLTLPPKVSSNKTWSNTDGGFTTGVDIFDKNEQEKLVVRANRFGLKPSEINNFTDHQLQQLRVSLGITSDNEKNIRFEAVHMLGTDDMTTEDIFEYYGKYGPAFIEWVSDESCNVIWRDKISAARALHFISKPIKGVPIEGPCDPFLNEIGNEPNEDDITAEKENDRVIGQSILLIAKNRQVNFETEDLQIVTNNNATVNLEENSVTVSDVSIPIPPGYWRLGLEHPKTKGLLLRFAYKTDKKPLKAERLNEFYKKHGNPNFDGLKGLISESRRQKFKGIFERNKDISKPVDDSKNPWGDLAEQWDMDEQFAEKIYEPQVAKNNAAAGPVMKRGDVKDRLGAKREHIVESIDSSSSNEENIVQKKSKIPRMRMYADEEEEKMKKRKCLTAVRRYETELAEETKKVQDLRNLIGTSKKPERAIEEVEIQTDTSDLATRLKNRTRSMYADAVRSHSTITETLSRSRDVERTLEKRKSRSSVEHRQSRHKRDSSSHRRGFPREHSRSRYKNRLHSDRYAKAERRQRHSYSDADRHDRHKPKSKVAVVIKTQKRPAVASTIWSRITPKKERLKTASERLPFRKDMTSSSDSDSSSESNSSSSSGSSSSESASESEAEEEVSVVAIGNTIDRPGFSNSTQSNVDVAKIKSPLRIEINNDHFKEE